MDFPALDFPGYAPYLPLPLPLRLDSQSAGSAVYEPQLCKLPSPTTPVHHDFVRTSSSQSYADESIESIPSVASIDSGYHSVATHNPFLLDRDYTSGPLLDGSGYDLIAVRLGKRHRYENESQRVVSKRPRYENESQRVVSYHGSNKPTSGQPGQSALPRSSRFIGLNDLNDHDKARPTCVQCGHTFSSRASLRRHQLSTTACPGCKSQSRTKRSQSRTKRHVDKVEDPTSTESAIDKRLELNDSKEKAQSLPRSTENFTRETVPTTSGTSRCPAISTTRSNLAQEEQTEQPGYVKKWVDSTCVIQSPPSGYSGEEMNSSGFDFGIESENNPARSESEEDRIDTDSESFVLTEYSVNSPDWDPTGAILVPMKLEYIDRLLSSFNLLQRQSQSSVASDMAGSDHSTGSSSDKRRASSPPPGNSSKSRLPKKTRRQSANGDDEEGQGGNDDGSNPQSTPPNIAEDSQGIPLSFACPFVKRYPHRYHKCYSHTLKDVARVKYHLFRDKIHRLPIYCPTCSETFSSEDLRDEHVRALNCTMKAPAKWEGITASQREQLNKRSPSTNSAVENWNAVYQILFPGDTVPASPYIDMSLSGDLRAFREHALSTGPSIWDDILRTRLPENLRSSQGELQSFYRSFYPEAMTRLFETWNSSRSTTRSIQSQSNPSLIRQETEYLAPPINTAAVDGSSSPSGSDSALGKSVTNGSQSEKEPSPASQNEVALPAQTQQQQQQQSVMQRDSQASLVHQQLQTPPRFPHSIPQTPSFTHMQNTNIPLGAQYSFGSAEFAGYGFSQNPYGPEFNQFQYQPPSAGFPQDAFYQSHQLQYQPHQMQTQPHQMQTQPHQMQTQPHQMQTQPHQMQNQPHQIQNQPHQMHNLPQRPYNIPTPHPHALNSMGPVWAPPE
jgi:hypothetical protein